MKSIIAAIMLIMLGVLGTVTMNKVISLSNNPDPEPEVYEPSEFVEKIVHVYYVNETQNIDKEHESLIDSAQPEISGDGLMVHYEDDVLGILSIKDDELFIIEFKITKSLTGKIRVHFNQVLHTSTTLTTEIMHTDWMPSEEYVEFDMRETEFLENVYELTPEDWRYIVNEFN